MTGLSPACGFCRTTRVLCFWGMLRPYEPGSRVLLFACSLLLAAGIGVSCWPLDEQTASMWILGGILFLVSALGLLVALFGCESCVVRMRGDV